MELNANLNFSLKTLKYNIVIYFYISAQDIWFWWSESKVLFFYPNATTVWNFFLKEWKESVFPARGREIFLEPLEVVLSYDFLHRKSQ